MFRTPNFPLVYANDEKSFLAIRNLIYLFILKKKLKARNAISPLHFPKMKTELFFTIIKHIILKKIQRKPKCEQAPEEEIIIRS